MLDMDNLYEAYENIKKILGKKIEPFESVKLVQEYREFWKPERVKVLLLAESHVFTEDKDREIKVISPDGLESYPSQFAKFIYCLAYGENSLKKGNETFAREDGTPQFWKLLYAANQNNGFNDDYSPVLKSKNPTTENRIKSKADLLLSLKKKGIWLVDTSIVALYPKSNYTAKEIGEVLSLSWECYVRKRVLDLKPSRILCIGKGIEGIVRKDMASMGENFKAINQPNARITTKERTKDLKTCISFCSNA